MTTMPIHPLATETAAAATPHATQLATTISWTTLATPFGAMTLYATALGLAYIALPGADRATAERLIRAQFGPVDLRADAAPLRAANAQLAAYCAGDLRAFTLPLDLRGTPFQRLVWAAVAAIPYGATRSYQGIAREIERPAAVRAVGAANGANPLPIVIPCHRVLGTDGSLTGYGGGLDLKRRLLTLEGALSG
ncbi:MAG TPA: methylated-DNA--[protein]-cysteine S-methyltransferase [Ktedonobacterales bacterium]|jgi:O-6-methylguanine DNA methyltransferase